MGTINALARVVDKSFLVSKYILVGLAGGGARLGRKGAELFRDLHVSRYAFPKPDLRMKMGVLRAHHRLQTYSRIVFSSRPVSSVGSEKDMLIARHGRRFTLPCAEETERAWVACMAAASSPRQVRWQKSAWLDVQQSWEGGRNSRCLKVLNSCWTVGSREPQRRLIKTRGSTRLERSHNSSRFTCMVRDSVCSSDIPNHSQHTHLQNACR